MGARAARLVLALDTASERCAAALLDPEGDRVLARADPVIGRGHAERLMPIVADLLAETGLAWRDVGRIGVGIGPGSFTGIRVALAAAHGLRLSLGCALVGVSSLDALAEPHWGEDAPVLAVQDAKRGELYAALFAPGGEALRSPEAVGPEALAAFCDRVALPPLLVGSGALIAADVLGSRAGSVRSTEGAADIGAVARLAARRAPAGEVRALYLRCADARPSAAASLLAPAETAV